MPACNKVWACCRDSGKYTFSVACFMLELYQDDLADLLLPPQPKVPTGRQAGSFGTQLRVPKLEIKKDAKGMVSVPGATMIEARLQSHLFTASIALLCEANLRKQAMHNCVHAGRQGRICCPSMICHATCRGCEGLPSGLGQPAES